MNITTVTVTTSETEWTVQAPYFETQISWYRQMGGHWDRERRVWVFDVAAIADAEWAAWRQTFERHINKFFKHTPVAWQQAEQMTHAAPATAEPATVTATEYGIGRVPADVDPIAESLAILDAAERTPQSRDLVTADCGHTIPRAQLMHASIGTACPDCYDEMENR